MFARSVTDIALAFRVAPTWIQNTFCHRVFALVAAFAVFACLPIAVELNDDRSKRLLVQVIECFHN